MIPLKNHLDFPNVANEIRSVYSSREEAIREIDSILTRLYQIKIYRNTNDPYDSLEYSIHIHYRFKQYLLTLPDWKPRVEKNKSFIDALTSIIAILVNPRQLYLCIRAQCLKIKEKIYKIIKLFII